ncbi:MAG: hypothetical protein ACPGNT_08385 [Rhodospirillales bacterium]
MSVSSPRVETRTAGVQTRQGSVVTLGRGSRMALSRPINIKDKGARGIRCTID